MPAKLLSQSSSSSLTPASLSSSPLAIFPSLWLSMSTACSSSYGRSRTCLAAVSPKWSWCRIHSLVTLWAQAPTLYSQDCCSLQLHILPVTDHRCIQCFSAVTTLSCRPFVLIMTPIIIEIQAHPAGIRSVRRKSASYLPWGAFLPKQLLCVRRSLRSWVQAQLGVCAISNSLSPMATISRLSSMFWLLSCLVGSIRSKLNANASVESFRAASHMRPPRRTMSEARSKGKIKG